MGWVRGGGLRREVVVGWLVGSDNSVEVKFMLGLVLTIDVSSKRLELKKTAGWN